MTTPHLRVLDHLAWIAFVCSMALGTTTCVRTAAQPAVDAFPSEVPLAQRDPACPPCPPVGTDVLEGRCPPEDSIYGFDDEDTIDGGDDEDIIGPRRGDDDHLFGDDADDFIPGDCDCIYGDGQLEEILGPNWREIIARDPCAPCRAREE